MKRPKIKAAHGNEYYIQRDVVKMLHTQGWHVERLVGMAFQSGLPDLLAGHVKFGMRFVEIKQEEHYRWTNAQRWKLPILMKNGMGVWILTEATPAQYERLFAPPNLWDYMKESDILTKESIDELFAEIDIYEELLKKEK